MAVGWTMGRTAGFGFRKSIRIGLLIRLAGGLGATTMDGPGSAPIRGAGRRITTAVGIIPDLAGLGGLGRTVDLATGVPRWSGSLVTEDGSVSVLALAMSAGCRW